MTLENHKEVPNETIAETPRFFRENKKLKKYLRAEVEKREIEQRIFFFAFFGAFIGTIATKILLNVLSFMF